MLLKVSVFCFGERGGSVFGFSSRSSWGEASPRFQSLLRYYSDVLMSNGGYN